MDSNDQHSPNPASIDETAASTEANKELTAEDVTKIARLARIKIDQEQIPTLTNELSKIIDLVDQMGQFPTKDIVPMAHPLDMEQRLRADKVTETNQRESFQSVAPQVEDGLYLVPKVIE